MSNTITFMHKGLIALSIVGLVVGCGYNVRTSVHGSGIPSTIVSAQRDFNGIVVANGCKTSIAIKDSFSVVVHIDDNLRNYVHVERSKKDLLVHLSQDYHYDTCNFSVDITMPDLAKLEASGAACIYLGAFDTPLAHNMSIKLSGASSLFGSCKYDDLDISISGASSAKINGIFRDLICNASGASTLNGVMAFRDVRLTVSGASGAEIIGMARNLAINASGAGIVSLKKFECGDVRLDLSGASRAEVNASGTITGALSGGSHLEYTGSPTLGSMKTSGGSSVAVGEPPKTVD
jgi:hypothetical protein